MRGLAEATCADAEIQERGQYRPGARRLAHPPRPRHWHQRSIRRDGVWQQLGTLPQRVTLPADLNRRLIALANERTAANQEARKRQEVEIRMERLKDRYTPGRFRGKRAG